VKLVTKKQMVDWQAYILNSQKFSEVQQAFVLAFNKGNKLGVKAVHYFTGAGLLDNLIGETRSFIIDSAYQLVKEVLSKSNAQQHNFHKSVFKNSVGDVATIVCESLIDTANQQGSIYQIIELSEEVSKSIMLQLKFIGSVCTKNNLYYSLFQNYSELLVKMVVLPLNRLTPTEKEQLEDNPSEFVSYALDLCGFHRSETPKSEAINMFEYLIENVDGCLTKSFHILFGMLSEAVVDEAGPMMKELGSIDKLKQFTQEDHLDVSLLLLANMSYGVSARSDLVCLLKGFVIGHLDKFLNIRSVILNTRLLMFFSQYAEYFYDSPQDLNYIQSIMKYIAKCLLEEKNPLVVVAYNEDQTSSSRVSQQHLQR
jgi:hypothetical protein